MVLIAFGSLFFSMQDYTQADVSSFVISVTKELIIFS